MGETTGQLKDDVRAKRAEVSRDLDALGDKLSPARALIAGRSPRGVVCTTSAKR